MAKSRITGLLTVPVADEAVNPAQHQFDTYLNTLDGFPTTSGASACFSAELKADTIAAGLKVVLLPQAAGEAPTVIDDVSVVGAPVQTLTCPVMTQTPCVA
ncbi:MAG: hypothetical protein JRH20_29560, partial [Deltaproteobacteria bacterium]|nr:hypothetical protein [Deltaproteobacteria bacterium]